MTQVTLTSHYSIQTGPQGPLLTFDNSQLIGGSSYTDNTYTAVPMTGGHGTGAQSTVVISGGSVTSVTMTAAGTGYVSGDTLSASNSNLGGTGSGFSIVIATVGSAGGNTYWIQTDGGVFGPDIITTGVAISSTKAVVATQSGNVGYTSDSGTSWTLVTGPIAKLTGGINQLASNGTNVVAVGTSATLGPVIAASAGGVVSGTISPGSGYTDGTYFNINLTGGSGAGVQAMITISGGQVTQVSIVPAGGDAYVVSDVLSANASDIGGTGTGFTYTVTAITPGALPTGTTDGTYFPVNFTGGTGTGAQGQIVINGGIPNVTITNGGAGYLASDVISYAGGGGLGSGGSFGVYTGTGAYMAVSTNGGASWSDVTPAGACPTTNIWYGAGKFFTFQYAYAPSIAANPANAPVYYSTDGVSWNSNQVIKASFVGTITGSTLDITSMNSGSVELYDMIVAPGTPAECQITAFGTGSGGVGTYTVNPTPASTLTETFTVPVNLVGVTPGTSPFAQSGSAAVVSFVRIVPGQNSNVFLQSTDGINWVLAYDSAQTVATNYNTNAVAWDGSDFYVELTDESSVFELYSSTNNGASFSLASSSGSSSAAPLQPYVVAFKGKVYTGVNSDDNVSLAVSSDQGVTWTPVPITQSGFSFTNALGADSNYIYEVGPGVLTSSDGSTFDVALPATGQSIFQIVLGSGQAYAVGQDGSGNGGIWIPPGQ